MPALAPCVPPSRLHAASEGASPSFQFTAPSGLTDSEDEEDESTGGQGGRSRRHSEAESRRRSSLGAGVRPMSPAELALTELTTRLEKQLKVWGAKDVRA